MASKNIALLALAFALAPLSASATSITDLFNTGVDGAGSVIADGATDSHYTIISSPGGAQIATKTPAGYPNGVWLANDSTSAWIGLDTPQTVGPADFYTYRTTFTLDANTVLSSVAISGAWGTDDYGFDIVINGVSTSQTSGSFYTLTNFAINSGFQVGTNSIDFLVYNSGGPTGLRVEDLVGTYQSVPDGGLTAIMLGSSLLGLVAFRRKFAK